MGRRRNRIIKVICILLSITFITNIQTNVSFASSVGTSKAVGSFDFDVEPNINGYGSVRLDWSGYNYKDKNFKVYKSTDGINYETVGIDYTLVKEVKCLQIYPAVGKGNGQLTTWMETNGYGKDIIKIDEVCIDDFNANPNGCLKNANGDWIYNVIFFGTWDCNGNKDLSESARIAVENYIKAGRGAIFAHDTIVNNWFNHKNFRMLAPYCGVNIVDDAELNSSDKVIIQKKGLFTTYPWYIGEVGTVLTIPTAHTIGQVVSTGTSWLRFQSNGSTMANGQIAPSYLTTYNNCAIIQTGHSNGQATTDEQKLLANLIFYVNQLIFNRHDTTDSSAQDSANPNNPTVSMDGVNFNFTATDNGSTYYYRVESYDKNDTTSTGILDKTSVKNVTVTTGVKGYRYILSNNKTEKINSKNGTYTTSTSLPINDTYKYFHVAAVDGAGNISGTTSVPIEYTIKYILNGGNITGEKTKYTVETDTFTLQIPEKTGYLFKGWTGSNGSTPQITVTIPKGSTGNRSYTANWTRNIPFTSNINVVGENVYKYTESCYYVQQNKEFDLKLYSYIKDLNGNILDSAEYTPTNNYINIKNTDDIHIQSRDAKLGMSEFKGYTSMWSLQDVNTLKILDSTINTRTNTAYGSTNGYKYMNTVHKAKLTEHLDTVWLYPQVGVDTGDVIVKSDQFPEDKKITVISDGKSPVITNDLIDDGVYSENILPINVKVTEGTNESGIQKLQIDIENLDTGYKKTLVDIVNTSHTNNM